VHRVVVGVSSVHGTAGAPALAAMLQQLFAAEALDDVRQAIAHGSHVLAVHDSVTLREVVASGALEATFHKGAPLDQEARTIERHLRRIAMSTGRTVTTLDRFDDEGVEALASSYRLRQGLCLVRPLNAYGARVGVVCFHFAGRGALRDAEFDSLRKFCDSAATALYNARVRAGLHRLAYTDQLTGLPNRHRLEEEMRKIRNAELTLLLIDFDGLKLVNDLLGYDRGDALITLIGGSLLKCLRDQDLAIRLGGDEFVVLLPETEEKIGRRRAEEIGATLDALEVPDDIKPYFRGASVGAATASPNDDLQSVLRRATDAMHSRKRRRKTDFTDSAGAAQQDPPASRVLP
jgi:diguanylate cyclase (GGDEF)-like protein